MAYIIIFVGLLIGGFIGWASFAFVILHIMRSRKKELQLLDEIQQDLDQVKHEIKKLK